MIHSKDRSGYFGASDTSILFGNWETPSFQMFWLKKLGLENGNFSNKYTVAGTYFEERIIDSLGLCGISDRQIIIEDLKLRVNYDFETADTIYEIKTYKEGKEFKVSKQYWRQAQVEMFANPKKLCIVAYPLSDEDYRNIFRTIDKEKLRYFPIEYDEGFINNEYLPRLKYLRDCLIKGVMPRSEEWNLITAKFPLCNSA